MTSGDIADQVVVGVGQLGELAQRQARFVAGLARIRQVAGAHPRDRQAIDHRAQRFGVQRSVNAALDLLCDPRIDPLDEGDTLAVEFVDELLAGGDIVRRDPCCSAGVLGVPLPLMMDREIARDVQDNVTRVIVAGDLAERFDD